jgi:hypothetical protein
MSRSVQEGLGTRTFVVVVHEGGVTSAIGVTCASIEPLHDPGVGAPEGGMAIGSPRHALRACRALRGSTGSAGPAGCARRRRRRSWRRSPRTPRARRGRRGRADGSSATPAGSGAQPAARRCGAGGRAIRSRARGRGSRLRLRRARFRPRRRPRRLDRRQSWFHSHPRAIGSSSLPAAHSMTRLRERMRCFAIKSPTVIWLPSSTAR